MKKRLWIDVLTPKQALFTKSMLERAPDDFECLVTTRDYSELNQFLERINFRAKRVGRHGGASFEEKLRASIERQAELLVFLSSSSTSKKFDLSLSFISPEAARVSFGLGVRHYICSDSPHAEAPCRLAVPLAAKLFSPFPITKERWTQYGIAPSRVFCYRALDPWAWLSTFKTMKNKKTVGRRETKLSILVRLEESFASYVKSEMGISNVLDELLKTIEKSIDGSSSSFEINIIPRYDEQRAWAKKRFGYRYTVPDSAVDGPDLIANSDLVIGGGGTMTQEAALLGVPNISYFPSAHLDVFENFYFPRELSVKARTPRELCREAAKLLQGIKNERIMFSKRARRAEERFQDPVKFIFDSLLKDGS